MVIKTESKGSHFYVSIGYVSLALLGLAVMISKEILVLNEETLVAISFIIFMIFAYRNLNDVFITVLEDRSKKIEKEFDHYFSLRENLLSLLISYHGTRKLLSNEMVDISQFSKSEIKHILFKRQKALANNLSLEVQHKLKTILLKELNILQQIQQETSYWFSKYVFGSFKTQNERLKDIMMRESINTINTMSKYSSIQGKSLDLNSDSKKLLNSFVVLHKTTNIPVDVLLLGYLCTCK